MTQHTHDLTSKSVFLSSGLLGFLGSPRCLVECTHVKCSPHGGFMYCGHFSHACHFFLTYFPFNEIQLRGFQEQHAAAWREPPVQSAAPTPLLFLPLPIFHFPPSLFDFPLITKGWDPPTLKWGRVQESPSSAASGGGSKGSLVPCQVRQIYLHLSLCLHIKKQNVQRSNRGRSFPRKIKY